MYDFGIDLGASFTKVTCLRRVPGVDSYADPIFNCGVATPLEVNAAYWFPPTRQQVLRSFLIPSVVLWDGRREETAIHIGVPASQVYRSVRDELAQHQQADPQNGRRVAIYPFFNWKRRFIAEPDAPCLPQPPSENAYTWTDIAREFLTHLRGSVGQTLRPAEGPLHRQRFESWLAEPQAHTRVCLPLTSYARENRARLETRLRFLLEAAGWPVDDDRKVIGWEGTANLLGRITRGRNRLLPGRLHPDIDGIFQSYGFRFGRPIEGWTCMAIDVGHYTTDVAVYRYQRDGHEFQNPSAMDETVFTRSEEVGVASHLDVRFNEVLEHHGLGPRDAITLLDFKQLWTNATLNKELPRQAALMLGVRDADLQPFIASVSNAYGAFADAVTQAVAASIQQCEQEWTQRPDARSFPKLHVNMIYLSGGVMEAPDLREMFKQRLRTIASCATAAFDSPDTRKGREGALQWNTRLRAACGAGVVSVLGDSRD